MTYTEGYIVCSNDIKNKILDLKEKENNFINYKYLTEKEFLEIFLGSIKDEAITFLTANTNYSVSELKMYLDNISNNLTNSNDIRLNKLKEIKDLLIKNNLLENTFLKLQNVINNHVTFINPFEINLIELVCNKYNIKYTIVNEFNYKKKDLSVNVFDTAEDEILFVFDGILKLVKKGISLNDIKIVNKNDDYDFIINRIASSLNIPINNSGVKNALSKQVNIDFINNLANLSFEDNINNLETKGYPKEDINNLINLINKYSAFKYQPSKLTELFKSLIKNLCYKGQIFDEGIDLISPSSISCHKDCYLFFINFDSNVPLVKKDDDFLTDAEKKSVLRKTSLEENDYNKELLKSLLYEADNLVITFSNNHSFSKMIISPLASELDMNIVKGRRGFGVSKEADDLFLATSLDNYISFNTKNDTLVNHYYKELPYKTYDNKFDGITKESYLKYVSGPLKLSYTKMDTYFSCPYSYFLKYVLRVDEYKSTLGSRLGTYAHGILEEFEKNKDSFDYEKTKEKLILSIYKDEELTLEDKFYIDRSDEYIKDIISFNNEKEKNSKIDSILTEEDIKISLHDGKVIFDGKIDKQYVKNINNISYIAVIDYKTYAKDNNLLNIKDGYNLQLPVYLYLINSKNSNVHYMGIYLQILNFNINKYEYKDKSYIVKEKGYKLSGFTSSDQNDLSILSNDFDTDNTSDYIPLRLTKNGIHGSDLNKALTQDDFKKLISVAKDKIEEMIERVNNLEFDIKPKGIDKGISNSFDEEVETSKYDHLPCPNCNMRDICYRKDSDIVILSRKPFVSKLKELSDKEKAKEQAEKEEE